MAEQSSKRASTAAKRGGILSRLGQNKIGRKFVAPAATVAALASQVNADQTRDRNVSAQETISKRKTPNAQPLPASRTDADGLRGAKPRPLLGMNAASQLAADQAQSRRQADAESGALADIRAGGDEAPLLELPTRSYARHAETDEEKELSRQRGMTRRMQQFLAPGGGPIGEEETQPVRQRAQQTPSEAQTETTTTPLQQEAPETVEEEDAARAAAFTNARQRAMQHAAQRAQAEQQAASQAQSLIKTSKRLRTAVKGIQAASAEAILPLFTLVIQMNVETFNKWVTGFRIPFFLEPEENPTISANDVATGCLDCSCCAGCFVFIGLFAFALTLIYIGSTDISAGFDFIWEAFKGTFG